MADPIQKQQIDVRRDGQLELGKNGQMVPRSEGHSDETQYAQDFLNNQAQHPMLVQSAAHGPAPTNQQTHPANPEHADQVKNQSPEYALRAQPSFAPRPAPKGAPELKL